MGLLKGAKEHKKFINLEPLTRKEAINAMCYICNGMEDSREDCEAEFTCPLYQWSPHAK